LAGGNHRGGIAWQTRPDAIPAREHIGSGGAVRSLFGADRAETGKSLTNFFASPREAPGERRAILKTQLRIGLEADARLAYNPAAVVAVRATGQEPADSGAGTTGFVGDRPGSNRFMRRREKSVSTGNFSRRSPRQKKSRERAEVCPLKPAPWDAAERTLAALGPAVSQVEIVEERLGPLESLGLVLVRDAQAESSAARERRARGERETAPQAPEDEELRRKRAQLTLLEEELARRETSLARLRTEMAPFEARYFRKIGIRCARLDDIEARVAELYAQNHPEDAAARVVARRARERANRSREAVRRHRSSTAKKPPEGLKRLYRAVARKVHPDFGKDQGDRDLRANLMAHANRAYERGDQRRLKAIVKEYEYAPEIVHGDGTPWDLVRVIRRISVLKARVKEIEQETDETRSSELCRFKAHAEAHAGSGRDVFAEVEATLNARIAKAQRVWRKMTHASTGEASRARKNAGAQTTKEPEEAALRAVAGQSKI
jgi:hypothetical protein